MLRLKEYSLNGVQFLQTLKRLREIVKFSLRTLRNTLNFDQRIMEIRKQVGQTLCQRNE